MRARSLQGPRAGKSRGYRRFLGERRARSREPTARGGLPVAGAVRLWGC
jgi:hypothetical protein